jgi:hypothetical protein
MSGFFLKLNFVLVQISVPLSIMTLKIATFSITLKNVTISVETLNAECRHYAYCAVAVMLSVIRLGVVAPSLSRVQ